MGGEESNERGVGIFLVFDQMGCLVNGKLEKANVHRFHIDIDKMDHILVFFFPNFLFF
jgi:hypothetical protein